MTYDSIDIAALLSACATGDSVARRRFHEVYGEDIYNYPVKICGASIEEAGDFYLYVFDNGRIFLRLKTFAERNHIQFRTFLSFYVLKHLFIEWRRTQKEIDTISLQAPIDDGGDEYRTLEDVLPSAPWCEGTESEQVRINLTTASLHSLTPEDQLYLKLLSLLECPLTPEEVRLLAHLAGRTIDDTLMLLTEIHHTLSRKDEKIACVCNDLDAVWGWITLRQKELQAISAKLSVLSTMENMLDTEALRARKRTLETTLARRIRQHRRLVEKLQTYKLTTPYKDIARLLNTTIASVYSRIFRLREHLLRKRTSLSSILC